MAFAAEEELPELQRLRSSYDDSVQRAVRSISQSYLQQLNRLRDFYVRNAKLDQAKQVDTEIALITAKLGGMADAAPSTIGHRTVLLEDRVTIPPNSPGGYNLGPVRQGDVIKLQYVSGLWKGYGGIPTENPDQPKEKDDVNQLVIARAPNNGKPGDIIAIVPPGTANKPFVFTFPTTREGAVLRIHKNSDNAKNPGTVVYQVQLSR